MSYRYIITLKPLEPFFFGGEFTFGADESRKESSRYSATSTAFPQQTAILGMLRKTMLIQNGHLTMHKKGEWVDSSGRGSKSTNYDNAKALVGTEAFSYETAISLGVIDSLSPLFIKESHEYFIANAKDNNFEIKEIEGSLSLGNGSKKAFVFEGFDAKESNYFDHISSTRKSLKNFSEFFETVERVGIKKQESGESEEDAFFRKKSYLPKKDAQFAFVATFSTKIEWDKQALVSLGAEQSSFMLNIEETQESFESLFKEVHQAKKHSRIVLASEMLLSKEAYEACSFILGDKKTYRQLTDARKGKKSKRYYLMQRGSVLYSENIENLAKLLNQNHLQAIGINHYFTIKGKK